MKDSGAFPDVAIKMVEVGESTGALQEMLNSLSDFYDEEIETNLGRFITIVEPALLVIMGIVIAGLLLSLYMPLFNLSQRAALSRCEATLERTNGLGTRLSALDTRAPTETELYVGADRRRTTPNMPPRSRTRGGWPSAIGSSSSTSTQFSIDHELFRAIPADLMLRYGFVPVSARRAVAGHRRVGSDRSADDRRARRAARRRPIKVTVGTPSAIQSILKKSESSTARAGGSDRELPAPDPPRRRRGRRASSRSTS